MSNNLFTDKKLCSCHMLFKSAHLKIRACHLIVELQLKVVTATAMKTEINIALSEIVYEMVLFPINKNSLLKKIFSM